MPKPWPRRAVDIALTTPIFTVERHHLVAASTEHAFHILRCPNWCNIVALTPDDHVVMVRQYRYGTDEETLELPGGMIDPEDPDPRTGAVRELREETGYAANLEDVIETGSIAPNPAMQTNQTYSFLARNVERVGAPALDAGEDIEVVTIPIGEIPALIARGEIRHALVVVAFAYAFGLNTRILPNQKDR